MRQIFLYCKQCRSKTDASHVVTGKPDFPVLYGAIIRCHTCKRTISLKKKFEGQAVAQSDRSGRLYW